MDYYLIAPMAKQISFLTIKTENDNMATAQIVENYSDFVVTS